MVYVGTKETGYQRDYNSYWADKSELLPNIGDDAKQEAQDQVKNQYPYAVYRTQQEVTQFAEQIFQQWQQEIGRPRLPSRDGNYSDAQWVRLPPFQRSQREIERWNNQLREMKRVYVSTFVGVYQEALAKKDEAARPKVQSAPQPQSAATPTTPSNAAIYKGATITIKNIEPGDDEIVYTLEINHPGVTDGVEVMQLGHSIKNSSTSSSYQGIAGSFSDATMSQGYASSSADTSKRSGFSVKKGGQFYIK